MIYEELDNTICMIDIYVESVTNDIMALENELAITNDIFIESSTKNSKNPFERIMDTIHTIFAKLGQVILKSKIKTKADIQQKNIDELKPQAKDVLNIKIKIQDVWSYYKFASDIIDKFINKPSSKTFKAMLKRKNQRIAIDELTRSLQSVASDMRTPSVRQFQITNANPHQFARGIVAKKLITTGGNTANLKMYQSQKKKNDEKYERNINDIANRDSKYYEVIDSETGEIEYDPKLQMMDYRDEVISYKNNHEKIVKASNAAFRATQIAGRIALLVGLFESLPKTTTPEKVTIGELCDRLVKLKAGKVPNDVNNIGKNMDSFLTRTETLKDLEDSTASTKLAQKVSKLLAAYIKFYQSMIDFYYSIIKSVINEGKGKSIGIYSPNKIVKDES